MTTIGMLTNTLNNNVYAVVIILKSPLFTTIIISQMVVKSKQLEERTWSSIPLDTQVSSFQIAAF